MAIDFERLINYSIPETRQHYRREEMAFYALSVGLGMNPLDEQQLAYVDYSHKHFKVLPCVAVVLGYPGFWLGNPDTGVDALRLVHGEQEIEWYHPIPLAGEVVGRTKVTNIIDKGKDKGALLYSEKELIEVATNKLLAKTYSTTFLRGDGGFGGAEGPVKAPHLLPVQPPDSYIDFKTRPEQALYYRLNGDDNPLHANPTVAKNAGFAQPILHGLCTLGVVFHALLKHFTDYQHECIKSMGLRFSAPVFPGETIRTEVWADGSFRARVLERDVIVINNGQFIFK